ncbi:hypothetical protein Tco_0965383 [Tanacetum coccineum]
MNLPEVPDCASLFGFDQRVSALESKMSEFTQTSQFANAFSSILGIVDQYLASKMKEAVDTSYAVASSLSEFELKKILIDKMETNKSINRTNVQKNLYNALVEAYNLDKDIITSYGEVFTVKRGRDDQDKDSEQADELVFKTVDSETPQDQRGNMGNIEDQPNVEAASKHDWFKEPERPPTLDPNWNDRQLIDFRPPQRWISQIAKATKPPHLFDELMHTPINFSAFVMNHLKIENLTQ